MLAPHKEELHKALNAHRAGRADLARNAYEQLRKLYPENFDVVHLLGLACFQLGDLQRGGSLIAEALKLNPNSAAAHNNLGNVRKAQGRLDDARALFDKAVALKPDYPEALVNRGTASASLGFAEDALLDFRRALKLLPNYPDAYIGQGIALRNLKRPEEALKSFEAAVALNPRHAEALANKGTLLLDLGRADEAVAILAGVVSLRPDVSSNHYNLGNAYLRVSRFDKAVASYDRAIGLKPDDAEAWSNRGNALRELQRLDEAMASYEQAISLQPDYALAWLGAGHIDSETGRFAEAEAKYRQARALDPRSVAPLCGIAEVRKFEAGDPLVAEFEELLARSSSQQDLSRLHHAFGKVCNDLGRYDDAVNSYAIGKKLLTSKFSTEHHREGYAALKRIFTPEFFAARAAFGLSDERPVFVVGMPRSGTTLAEQIMASHHLVDGLGELLDVRTIVRTWCGNLGDPAQFAISVMGLKPDDVKAMAGRYLDVYRRSRKDAIRVVDKLPHNYEWLGIIALMFPRAHVVHCRRDPLDNCVSMYMQNFNGDHGYNQDLSGLGRYYREYERLMDHWSAVLPLPIHDLVYEDLVADLEASSRSLISFLGLDWDPNCLNYHQQDRQVSTPSRWQVRQPVYRASVGRWRRYEKHLGPLKEGLGIS